ncbi:MAG: hypothetical protein AAGA54_23840 [Myxococcota bacterium]
MRGTTVAVSFGDDDPTMRTALATTLVLFASIGLPGCDQEAPEMVTLRVDHFREACPDGAPGYCLRVQEEGDDQVAYAREIAGFDHEWGSEYELTVLVADDDADIRSYDLVEVLTASSAEFDARFEMQLAPSFVERVDRNGFRLLAETAARCETEAVCSDVADALYDGAWFTLEMSHDQARPGSFVAHGVARRTE